MVIDGGDLFWKTSRVSDADLPQRLVKANLQAMAYAKGGIDAFVPGEGDLAIGVDNFLGVVDTHKLPVLAGNLSCGDRSFPVSRSVERGGRTVGLLGVVTEDLAGCTTTSAEDSLRAGLTELGVDGPNPPDVVVAIVHGDADSDRVIAKAFPQVDFILNGHQRMLLRSPNVLANGVMELGSGSRGKQIGLLELEFVEGGTGWQDTGAASDLNKRIKDLQKRIDKVQSTVDDAEDEAVQAREARRLEYYNKQLGELNEQLALVASAPDAPSNRFKNALLDVSEDIADDPEMLPLVEAAKAAVEEGAAPLVAMGALSDTPYVGSLVCSACHAEQSRQWEGTGHAKAYKALEEAGRHLDNDCFSCHVTGAFDPAGPQLATQVLSLENVGCESCHGAGREHAANPELAPKTAQVSPDTCTQCHDGDQDGGRFELETYWPKVLHGAKAE